MIEIKAPNPQIVEHNLIKIFLAGSIEMGTAENWQERIVDEFKDSDFIFFNPRRDNWDSSIEQSKDNEAFAEQVNWELDGLEYADVVVFYFDPNTKSPISLLELGLVAGKANEYGITVIVCCPDGFYRKGNVEIVCDRYFGLHLVHTFEDLIWSIKCIA